MPKGKYTKNSEYRRLEWKKGIRKGKPKTDLEKLHISEGHKKYYQNPENRLKTSIATKRSFVKYLGKNHWNWKGGLFTENEKQRWTIEYDLWRKAVFSRDNYICQICKQKGSELNSHHIKPFSIYKELRFAIDNGITLCRKCHRRWHNENL